MISSELLLQYKLYAFYPSDFQTEISWIAVFFLQSLAIIYSDTYMEKTISITLVYVVGRWMKRFIKLR